MKSSKAFWAAFWGGVAAPGMLFAADCPKISRVEPPHASRQNDLEAMRSDWIAVGEGFKRVIESQKTAIR